MYIYGRGSQPSNFTSRLKPKVHKQYPTHPAPYFDKFTLSSVFWKFNRSLRGDTLGNPNLWHLPGLSDDASAGVSHPDAGPEVDGVPLVVGQAVLHHDVEMLLQLKQKIQWRSV